MALLGKKTLQILKGVSEGKSFTEIVDAPDDYRYQLKGAKIASKYTAESDFDALEYQARVEKFGAELREAAGYGRTTDVWLLLKARADPDSPCLDDNGNGFRGALHEACIWCGGQEVITKLLEYGANPDRLAKLKGRDMTAEQMAHSKGHHDLAHLIQSWRNQAGGRVAARLPGSHGFVQQPEATHIVACHTGVQIKWKAYARREDAELICQALKGGTFAVMMMSLGGDNLHYDGALEVQSILKRWCMNKLQQGLAAGNGQAHVLENWTTEDALGTYVLPVGVDPFHPKSMAAMLKMMKKAIVGGAPNVHAHAIRMTSEVSEDDSSESLESRMESQSSGDWVGAMQKQHGCIGCESLLEYDTAVHNIQESLHKARGMNTNDAWHALWHCIEKLKSLDASSPCLSMPLNPSPCQLVEASMLLGSSWYSFEHWDSALQLFSDQVTAWMNQAVPRVVLGCCSWTKEQDEAVSCRTVAQQMWIDLEKQQQLIRGSLSNVDQLVEKRDEMRLRALQSVQSWLNQESTRSYHSNADRLNEVQYRLAFLQEGVQLNPQEGLEELRQLRQTHAMARRAVRAAAGRMEEAVEDGLSVDEARDAETVARRQMQLSENAFAERWSKLCHLSKNHAPELMDSLLGLVKDQIASDLKTTGRQCVEISQVLRTERTLLHYGSLASMSVMSESGAQHRIISASYDGCPCVLKEFQISSGPRFRTFLREIEYHLRLQHPLIAPVQAAFFDEQNLCGYLQFDKYDCDVGKWAASGQLCEADILRASRAMALAVAHLHALQVVHGDIKPSNFLRGHDGTPLLCDFETAHASQSSGVTITKTVRYSSGFLAPELCFASDERHGRDPSARVSMASDVFALGRTLMKISEGCVCIRHVVREPLSELLAAMTCSRPDARPSAAQCASCGILADSLASNVLADQTSVAFPYHWFTKDVGSNRMECHPSEIALERIRSLWASTICTTCMESGISMRISRVSQIENPILWRAHASKKATLDALHREHNISTRTFELLGGHAALKIDDHLNQVYLWHGCSPETARIIETFGFDERLAHARDLYGVGTYFTDEVCKALQYSRATGCNIHRKKCNSWYCRCPGPKALLLCRVILGDPYYVQSGDSLVGRRRPPDRLDICGLPYDSVIAARGIKPHGKTWRKAQMHREVVIFDRLLVYPEFYVELESES